MSFFFFNDTATTEIYTLSLHDALPIYEPHRQVDTERLLAFEAHVGEVDRLGAEIPNERGVVGHRGLVDSERLDDDLPDAHAHLRAGPDFRGVWLHALWRLLTRCRRPRR